MAYPILEFDPERTAFIEPSALIDPRDVPDACVVSFFGDVVERIAAERGAWQLVRNRWEDGPHPIWEIDLDGKRLAFFSPGVGAPLACGLLEVAIALGCRRFVVCGGAGALDRDLTLGHLVVVTSAIRDEGTSYHYLPPARVVDADEAVVRVLEETLDRHEVPWVTGRTWTTDGVYRETRGRIAARRGEGAITVEMEAASLLAVAQFRGVRLGQILYAGDDLSGAQWDGRGWQSRDDIRTNLFWLAAQAALAL